jgi:hypothetical protein
MTGKKPSLNPSLFKGLATAEPSRPEEGGPAAGDVETQSPELRVRRSTPSIESSSTPAIAMQGRRYRRLHLYASEEMLRRVRQMQSEALAANLPMGQRGPSVVMAAALDRFEQLSKEDRLEAMKKRLRS